MFFLSCVMLMNMLIVFKELSNYQWNSIVVIYLYICIPILCTTIFVNGSIFKAKNNGAE